MEKQQAKEAERVAKQQAITYTMRVTDMLISMEEEDKDNFRTGSEGAVVRKRVGEGCRLKENGIH